MPKTQLHWGTLSEKGFIKTAVENRTPREAVKFLQGYLKGVGLRKDWDGMDKRAVVNYASRLLKTALATEMI